MLINWWGVDTCHRWCHTSHRIGRAGLAFGWYIFWLLLCEWSMFWVGRWVMRVDGVVAGLLPTKSLGGSDSSGTFASPSFLNNPTTGLATLSSTSPSLLDISPFLPFSLSPPPVDLHFPSPLYFHCLHCLLLPSLLLLFLSLNPL